MQEYIDMDIIILLSCGPVAASSSIVSEAECQTSKSTALYDK